MLPLPGRFDQADFSTWFPSGIFSDTHLLTMMYIGEMCFWAVKYEDCSADSTERKEDSLQFRDIGTQILNKYVLACEGPLQGQGWNTENAKEILSILQWMKLFLCWSQAQIWRQYLIVCQVQKKKKKRMEHSRQGGGIVDMKVIWQVEAQWEKCMKGSVPVGTLIPRQTAQPRARGREERRRGRKVDKKNKNNWLLLESKLSSHFWICRKSSFILIPDCWLGHLFCSKRMCYNYIIELKQATIKLFLF